MLCYTLFGGQGAEMRQVIPVGPQQFSTVNRQANLPKCQPCMAFAHVSIQKSTSYSLSNSCQMTPQELVHTDEVQKIVVTH